MGEAIQILAWLAVIFFIVPIVAMGIFSAIIAPLHWLLKGARRVGLKDEVN